MSRALIAAEYAHKLTIIELTAPASEKGFRIAALMAERAVRLDTESKAPRHAHHGLYRLASADLKRRHQQERQASMLASRNQRAVTLHQGGRSKSFGPPPRRNLGIEVT